MPMPHTPPRFFALQTPDFECYAAGVVHPKSQVESKYAAPVNSPGAMVCSSLIEHCATLLLCCVLCSRLTLSAEQLPRAEQLPCNASYFRHRAAQESLLSCNAYCTNALCTKTSPTTNIALCRLCGVPCDSLCTGLHNLPRTALPGAPQVDLQYWGPAVLQESQQTPA